MTAMEALQVGALVVGVGSPVATLLYWRGKLDQRLANIESMQAAILEKEAQCQAKREHVEDEIRKDFTKIVGRVGRIEGRLNGRVAS